MNTPEAEITHYLIEEPISVPPRQQLILPDKVVEVEGFCYKSTNHLIKREQSKYTCFAERENGRMICKNSWNKEHNKGEMCIFCLKFGRFRNIKQFWQKTHHVYMDFLCNAVITYHFFALIFCDIVVYRVITLFLLVTSCHFLSSSTSDSRENSIESRPLFLKSRPLFLNTRPLFLKTRPLFLKSRPLATETRPLATETRPQRGLRRPRRFVPGRGTKK